MAPPPPKNVPPVKPPVVPTPNNTAALYTLAGVIFASTIAAIVTQVATKSAFDAKMVEIGVNILSADPGKSDVSPARQWAIDLIESRSGQKFGDTDREQLLHHSIAPTLYNLPATAHTLVEVPCDAWRRNADGSWTQTGTIKDANGNTFVGNAVMNTAETDYLEQNCRVH